MIEGCRGQSGEWGGVGWGVPQYNRSLGRLDRRIQPRGVNIFSFYFWFFNFQLLIDWVAALNLEAKRQIRYQPVTNN